MAPEEKEKRLRVQLDFSQEAYERLQQIKTLAGTTNNTDLFRQALRVYEWYLRQHRQGYRVQVVKGDTVRDVEFVL